MKTRRADPKDIFNYDFFFHPAWSRHGKYGQTKMEESSTSTVLQEGAKGLGIQEHGVSSEALAWRGEVVLGCNAICLKIALLDSAQRRFHLGIVCPEARGCSTCSARLAIVDRNATGQNVRRESTLIDGFQMQGRHLSVEQIFDVPAISRDSSVHLFVELGPVTGFRQVQAKISVQMLPHAPQSGDSDKNLTTSPQARQRTCRLRASSRHFDETTELPIATEYCGGSLFAQPEPFDLNASPSVVSPSIHPLASPGKHKSKSPGGLLGWASQLRGICKKSAATSPEKGQHQNSAQTKKTAEDGDCNMRTETLAVCQEDPLDHAPVRSAQRTWGWGQAKRSAGEGAAAGVQESLSSHRSIKATAFKSPKVYIFKCVCVCVCVCVCALECVPAC